MTHFDLNSKDLLTTQLNTKGILTWNQLCDYVQKLPYGRNSNRSDFSLVLIEGKGTCSSKHAFLKKMADLNDISGVILILGIYKMNKFNTPGIGRVLDDTNLDYIPEAHCYLSIDGKRYDYTNTNSDIRKIESDIIHEQEIDPEQVISYKIDYHKSFIMNWLEENDLGVDFEQLWQLREACIMNLSSENSNL